MKYDIAIIGAGITGCCIAFELSKYDCRVVILEKENDVSERTTKANSAIIHAGYDPKPGTKMARLNVLGSELAKQNAAVMNYPYQQIGSLVLGSTPADEKLIDELYERGVRNGVKGMRVLKSREEILALGEKNLSDNICYALYAPSAAIVYPWQMCLSYAENALKNGVELKLNTAVKDIEETKDGFSIKTDGETIEANYVINCAGTHADDIYHLALKGRKAEDDFTIIPARGEYYLLDKNQGSLASHVLFQTPTEKGKGVLVSPTTNGNLIVGPDAAFGDSTKDDVGNTQKSMDYVREMALRTSPKIGFEQNIRNFAGIRATIAGRDDFLIEESKEVPHFINFAGIKSPGLSCGPAFGIEAVEMLQRSGLDLTEKKTPYQWVRRPDFFKDLSEEEKIAKIKENPLYGQVICRCETITQAEIIAAMHEIIPARTIDGVKRRVNAGMGRCQGGFCGPKVFDLLRSELGLNWNEVYQDRNGSQVVVARTKGE